MIRNKESFIGSMNRLVNEPANEVANEVSGVRWCDLAPFFSVAIIAICLFFIAFTKMELRRMGYSIWKLSREERSLRDQEREVTIRLAQATKPERLASVAKRRLTLRRAEKGQIIHMTESGLALEQ